MKFSPTRWKEYQLIDSGDGLKLERFGNITHIRPEIAAIWPKSLSEREWNSSATARFVQKDAKSGYWEEFAQLPSTWEIRYPFLDGNLQFSLKPTQFKHVGLFPEQAVNWEYIARMVFALKEQGIAEPSFLNLFAYTGGASIAARAAGARVTHVDSLKQLVTWANENQSLNRLSDIRWLVEDALKFAEREGKRGNKYHGIILDPPSWGMGPKGEKWKLEDQINDLFQAVAAIREEKHFVIINTYSGLSPLQGENIARHWFSPHSLQCGEICLIDSRDKALPLGSLVRLDNLSE
jgi:23S rRNA (cytosine1962-C5)-methyltransferase